MFLATDEKARLLAASAALSICSCCSADIVSGLGMWQGSSARQTKRPLPMDRRKGILRRLPCSQQTPYACDPLPPAAAVAPPAAGAASR